MKGSKIKLVTIILAIVLITLVGFFGVYVQEKNRMEDKVKEYSLGADLKGTRTVVMKPSTATKSVVKDSEGKEVENSSSLTDEEIQEKGYTKEEVKYNADEVLTAQNYQESEKVMGQRLKTLGVSEYTVRLDEETGNLIVELPEEDYTDDILNELVPVNKFEIVDKETKEVLIDKSDIEYAQVLYSSNSNSTDNGTVVLLSIQFNKEGTKKYEEITTKYNSKETKESPSTESPSTESPTAESPATESPTTGDTTSSTSAEKKVELLLDGESIMSTSFEKVDKSGIFRLSYGQASTDQKTINENAEKATAMANSLNSETLPIKYEVDDNKYLLSDIREENIKPIAISILVVFTLGLLILVIKYKTNGLFTAISYIGLTSLLLLVIRYANVMISIPGLMAVVLILALNYVFSCKFLQLIDKEKEVKIASKTLFKDFFIRLIPVIVMSITFTFINWVPISSFGMIMFWGIVLIAIYNFLITKTLIDLKNQKVVEAEIGGTNNEGK